MAKPVKNFSGFERSTRYPWDKWLDGQVWLLLEGEDYQSLTSLRTGAGAYARARGLRARTRSTEPGEPKGVYLQAVPRDGEK